jgi:hypothetical protein
MKKWFGLFLSLFLIIALCWISGLFHSPQRSPDIRQEIWIAQTQNQQEPEKKGESDSHLVQVLKELRTTLDGWLKSLNERIEREDITRFEVRFLEILRSILEWIRETINSYIESSEEMAPRKGRRDVFRDAILLSQTG